MRIAVIVPVLVIIQFFMVQAVYSETIYTKDGEELRGTITEIAEDIIWLEINQGEVTEYIGIDKSNVARIVNDDGSPYTYPSNKKEEN